MQAQSAVQLLVDKMLDQANAAWPGIEYAITLSEETSLLLPIEGRELHRQVNGREGSYAGHVYRDCLVSSKPILPCLVSVGPVLGTIPEADKADRYWGNLDTQTFSTEPPDFANLVCGG